MSFWTLPSTIRSSYYGMNSSKYNQQYYTGLKSDTSAYWNDYLKNTGLKASDIKYPYRAGYFNNYDAMINASQSAYYNYEKALYADVSNSVSKLRSIYG